MVAVHIVSQIEFHSLQQAHHRLVHSHLCKLVVYLLDLTNDAVEWYDVTSGARSDEDLAEGLNRLENFVKSL